MLALLSQVVSFLRQSVRARGRRAERGLETVEYALMIVAIALVIIATARFLGAQILSVLMEMASELGT